MSRWRQLSWQIVAVQVLVVIVGVITLMVTADLLAVRTIAPDLLPRFRSAMAQALFVAAVAAALVGTIASVWLAGRILRPLRELAQRSQRIAAGHYDERVVLPAATELANLAHSFNQMTDALARTEQQRVALIGNVAHELRTPLAGLEGYLEGLLDGVLPGDPETIGAMQHEVRRLRRLVDDLQQLSRVETGQVALNIEDFDVVPVVQRVVTQLRPQLIEQVLEVEIADAAPELWVRADPDRTAQIVVNLLGNAIRYTPENGRIVVRLRRELNQAVILVEDTGIGIPASALPYIFERFYRVDPSRSRTSGGSGIGLTIARHLAWAMGGEISATSPGPGQGSTFRLFLPLNSRTYLD
jgi:histidine kinase